MRRYAYLLVLAALAVATLGSSAEAEIIATSVDAGEFVSASASDYFIEDPASLSVDVTARPPANIEVDVGVSCSRGSNRRSYDRELITTDPIHRRVKLPISRPDECSLSVDASYVDFEQTGRIAVRLRATFRR
jgi:hypothetical protein